MSAAAKFLRQLRDAGVAAHTDGSRLYVSGPSTFLTAALYQRVTYHKFELIELLEINPRLGCPSAAGPNTTDSTAAGPADSAFGEEAQLAFGGLVQVRPAGARRFAVCLLTNGRLRRGDVISTPSFDHAKRFAEQLYGPPLAGWHALEGGRQ